MYIYVQEKQKRKNKLVSRLLGISKDSVLTVDYESKEVLQRWPLDHVRRWAPTANGFTLDLGEYADEYYSVLTDESVKMAELLAGYIDLLLKKRKIVEQTVPDGTSAFLLLLLLPLRV